MIDTINNGNWKIVSTIEQEETNITQDTAQKHGEKNKIVINPMLSLLRMSIL